MGWWKNLFLIFFRKFQKFLLFLKFSPIFYFTKIKNIFKIEACSSGDRASDSDSESQGFDSLHAYELNFVSI